MFWARSDFSSLFSRMVFPRGVEVVTRVSGECISGLALHSAPCNPHLWALATLLSTGPSAVSSHSLGAPGD